jgi:hypothetical protein
LALTQPFLNRIQHINTFRTFCNKHFGTSLGPKKIYSEWSQYSIFKMRSKHKKHSVLNSVKHWLSDYVLLAFAEILRACNIYTTAIRTGCWKGYIIYPYRLWLWKNWYGFIINCSLNDELNQYSSPFQVKFILDLTYTTMKIFFILLSRLKSHTKVMPFPHFSIRTFFSIVLIFSTSDCLTD